MKHVCQICGMHLKKHFNLKRHLLRLHQISGDSEVSKYRNKCLECSLSFPFRRLLRQHLLDHHGVQPETEIVHFSTKTEFDGWLDNLARNFQSEYVKSFNKKARNGIELAYYHCSRSADHKILKVGGRQRQLKRTGSKKMDCNCTSEIIMKKKPSGEYLIQFFKNHYGHQLELRHIHLPKPVRREVEQKLLNHVPPSSIVDSFRTMTGENLKREHLINRQDILNIAAASHIPIRRNIQIEVNEGDETENLLVGETGSWVDYSNENSNSAENPSYLSSDSELNYNEENTLYINKINAEMLLAMETLTDMSGKYNMEFLPQMYDNIKHWNDLMCMIKNKIPENSEEKSENELQLNTSTKNMEITSTIKTITSLDSDLGNNNLIKEMPCSLDVLEDKSSSNYDELVKLFNVGKVLISRSSSNDHAYAASPDLRKEYRSQF